MKTEIEEYTSDLYTCCSIAVHQLSESGMPGLVYAMINFDNNDNIIGVKYGIKTSKITIEDLNKDDP